MTFRTTLIAALAVLGVVAFLNPDRAFASQRDGEIFAKMFAEANSRNWERARRYANGISDPVALDIYEWVRLRSGEAEWSDYLDFLSENGDWPGLKLLRRVGEKSIPDDALPDHVFEYFGAQPPQSGAGAVRLATALRQVGQIKESNELIAESWLTLPFTAGQQKEALAMFGAQLKGLHAKRLDNALWEGRIKESERMLPMVSTSFRKLAIARIELRKNVKNTTDVLNSVPKKFLNDPGLAFERFQWRLRNGLGDSAIELLSERSSSAKSLGKPEFWAEKRRTFARNKMRSGNSMLAYRLASTHYLEDGPEYADFEWLSGYIALRKLDRPERAILHFQRFREEIDSYISYGRAGYWLGRAYEAVGNTAAARSEYRFAANFQTTFYGQLAAQKIGASPDTILTGKSQFPHWNDASFKDNSVVRAAFLLNDAGNPSHAAWFLAHCAETMDRMEIAQLSQMALDKGANFAAIKVAKQGLKQGDLLIDYLFPLTGIENLDLAVPPEIAISVVRQESEFNHRAKSSAGALGLMQLMPKTAMEVARKFGVQISTKNIIANHETNVTLGSLYLRERLKSFDGSLLLATASYNAGPARVRKWFKTIGDPREPNVDAIDWIEHIPFNETRNYVMRVLEAITIYRIRIQGYSQSWPITDFLS